jgi:lipid-binding SYLF domain-containing protein
MLLQGGTKHAFQFFKNGGKVEKPQSTFDKSKETIRNVYEQTTDTAKNKFQDVIDKVKTGSNIKNPLKHEEPTMTEKITQVKDSFVQTAKETIDNLKEKSQETLDTIKEKSQAAMDSVKGTPPKQESFGAAKVFENAKASSQAAMDKAKDTFTETHTNILHMFEMPGLIEQAYSSLEEFLSPRLKLEEQIPTKLLGGAKAVVFLTVYKGGLGITGVFGSGIIVARNEIGHWSGPCAIALMGIDVGLNIGVEKSNHVIILRDDSAVRAFASIGQLKLGVDASIAAGPIGRDTSASLSVGDKGYATISSYSMATGAYVGLSFEGQIIAVRHDCNEEYYGKKVTALEILDGTVKPPKNKQLKGMYKLIDEYTGRSLVYPEHSTEL